MSDGLARAVALYRATLSAKPLVEEWRVADTAMNRKPIKAENPGFSTPRWFGPLI